jgi:predicted ATPase
VTLLFTDIEGSTRLLHDLGEASYARALADHRRVLRTAFAQHAGVEVDTQGDAFFVAFPTASGAVSAASECQRLLAAGPIRVRIGVHTGTPRLTEEGYVGEDLHKGARIGAAGHGGQVLLSRETSQLVDVDLTDLGEHRLKDFSEPIWIFQLGKERFPPLKTISNTNLPRPASSFVGRGREVAEVTGLIRSGARLVTLSGPGGSGKTRLAIESASGLVPEFKNGVFWVELAALRDPALVPETIATTLGAKDGLVDHIGEREILLLVDNLEQVIDAAGGLASLVETCPQLVLLVTSRELLRVRGEIAYAVPPLAESEAVDLFCQRSQVEADDVVRELCDRLDDLPLAVELAAARASLLMPGQILERLGHRLDLFKGGRDADPRQRTLRATIEWSFDLLDDDERRLFTRLGVFEGGCTLGTAEMVVDADIDVLQSLVEKSLVRITNARFWMLETIREYAIERLDELPEGDDIRGRHADHFLAMAEEAEPHARQAVLHGHEGDPGAWLDRLEMELGNFRGALDHLEDAGRAQDALRLAAALHEFWEESEHLEESGQRLRHLLELNPEATAARGRALFGVCAHALGTGDQASALAAAEEALAIFRALDDRFWIGEGLWALGVCHSNFERYEEALPHLEQSIALFQDLGDDDSVLGVGWPLAWTLEEAGDLEGAWDMRQELLDRARASGNTVAQMRLLGAQSINSLNLGRPASESRALVHEHLPLALGQDRHTIGVALSRCAHVLARTGVLDAAAQILARAEALFDELGFIEPWVALMDDQTKTAIRAGLDVDGFARATERGCSLTLDEAVVLARAATDVDLLP